MNEKISMGNIRRIFYQSNQKNYQGYIYIYLVLCLLLKMERSPVQCPARDLESEVISNKMLEGLDLALENNDS